MKPIFRGILIGLVRRTMSAASRDMEEIIEGLQAR